MIYTPKVRQKKSNSWGVFIMKLTYEDKVLIYELRKEEMIDKILHEYCSQDRVSLEYSLPNQGMLPNWLAQYKKKLEEMTELERLQAENAVLKNVSTPIEGRKTEIVRGLVTEFSLDMLLKIIKLARSTYYYHLKQLDKSNKDHAIKAEIQAIFTEHKEITAIVE